MKKFKNNGAILTIGLVAAITQLGAFTYFLSTSYITKLNGEFLSLHANAGNCEPVTLSETNVYYVDKYGSWDQAVS